jgi:hypothetical protein
MPWSLLITGCWLDSAKEQAVRLTIEIRKMIFLIFMFLYLHFVEIVKIAEVV